VYVLTVILSSVTVTAEEPEGKPGPALEVGSAAKAFACDDKMVIAGGIGPAGSGGQEGRLGASATVIRVGGERVAVVACDILMMRRDYFDQALRTIEKDTGIPFANVLVNATHTHHAPSTVRVHGYDRIESFCAHVRDQIVAAVKEADERAKKSGPIEFRFALGHESSVGQNSRLLLDDGMIHWIGDRRGAVRPTGPFDPQLPVFGFKRHTGGYEAVWFNHSTHAIGTIRPGVRSPTFYGLAAQALEKELGGTVTFISGAFGSTHNLTLDCREMTHRMSAAVRDALDRAEPRALRSARSIKREYPIRVRHFDEMREDHAVSKYCKKYMGGDPSYCIEVFRKMRKELAASQGKTRKTWLQAMRVGDVAIVGVPGELFTSLGLEIKRRSPFRYTYVAGAANDYIGYIPDERAYELGGYQVWTGFHSFVAKGTGEAMVEEAVKMLEELKAK